MGPTGHLESSSTVGHAPSRFSRVRTGGWLIQSCSIDILWLLFNATRLGASIWVPKLGLVSLPIGILLVGTQGSRALVTISNHQPVQCSSTCSGLYSSAKESTPSEMHLIAAHYISQHRQQHSNGLWTVATSFAFVTKGRQLYLSTSLCAKRLWDLMQQHDCAVIAMCKGGYCCCIV